MSVEAGSEASALISAVNIQMIDMPVSDGNDINVFDEREKSITDCKKSVMPF